MRLAINQYVNKTKNESIEVHSQETIENEKLQIDIQLMFNIQPKPQIKKFKHNKGLVHHKSRIKPWWVFTLLLQISSLSPKLKGYYQASSLVPKCYSFKNKRGETLGRVFSLKRFDIQPQRVDLVLSRLSLKPYNMSPLIGLQKRLIWVVRVVGPQDLCRGKPIASSFVALLLFRGEHNFLVRTPNCTILVLLERS